MLIARSDRLARGAKGASRTVGGPLRPVASRGTALLAILAIVFRAPASEAQGKHVDRYRSSAWLRSARFGAIAVATIASVLAVVSIGTVTPAAAAISSGATFTTLGCTTSDTTSAWASAAVPANATSALFSIIGGGGGGGVGGKGGKGAVVGGTIPVVFGQVMWVRVGCGGLDLTSTTSNSAGYTAGGRTGNSDSGGGGGSTGLCLATSGQDCSSGTGTMVAVAGGGGGGSQNSSGPGTGGIGGDGAQGSQVSAFSGQVSTGGDGTFGTNGNGTAGYTSAKGGTATGGGAGGVSPDTHQSTAGGGSVGSPPAVSPTAGTGAGGNGADGQGTAICNARGGGGGAGVTGGGGGGDCGGGGAGASWASSTVVSPGFSVPSGNPTACAQGPGANSGLGGTSGSGTGQHGCAGNVTVTFNIPAATLAFVSAPGTTAAGTAFVPQPVVRATASGTAVPNEAITLKYSGTDASGNPVGLTTLSGCSGLTTNAAGIMIPSGCSISTSGVYTLQASNGVATPVTSAPFTVASNTWTAPTVTPSYTCSPGNTGTVLLPANARSVSVVAKGAGGGSGAVVDGNSGTTTHSGAGGNGQRAVLGNVSLPISATQAPTSPNLNWVGGCPGAGGGFALTNNGSPTNPAVAGGAGWGTGGAGGEAHTTSGSKWNVGGGSGGGASAICLGAASDFACAGSPLVVAGGGGGSGGARATNTTSAGIGGTGGSTVASEKWYQSAGSGPELLGQSQTGGAGGASGGTAGKAAPGSASSSSASVGSAGASLNTAISNDVAGGGGGGGGYAGAGGGGSAQGGTALAGGGGGGSSWASASGVATFDSSNGGAGATGATSVSVGNTHPGVNGNAGTIGGVQYTVSGDGVVFTSAATKSSSVGVQGSHQVTLRVADSSTGITVASPSVTYSLGSVITPTANFQINSSTGVITGTPPAVGTYTLMVKAVSGSFTGLQALTWTAVNDPPTGNTAAHPVPRGTTTGFQLAGSDPNSDPLTYTLVSTSLPGGVTPNCSTSGACTVAVPANFAVGGPYNLVWHVTDGLATTADITDTVTITNAAPTATGSTRTIQRGTSSTFNLAGTDPTNGDTLDGTVSGSGYTKVSSASMPSGSTTTCTAAGVCTVSVAANTTPGDYSFTWKVADNIALSTTATETVTVANTAPVASTVTVNNVQRGRAPSEAPFDLSAIDTNNDALTYSVVTNSLPASSTLSCTSAGACTVGVPSNTATGNYTFTYKANDNDLDSNTSTVTVGVLNTNPVAHNVGPIHTTVGAGAAVTLDGTDFNGDTLSYTAPASAPAKGSVSGGSSASRTYTASSGKKGADSFTYTTSDNGPSTSAEGTVSMVIDNSAPSANDQTLSAPHQEVTPITLSGADDNADSLTFAVLSNVTKGVLSCNTTTGVCTYKANAGARGDDSFTFVTNDGTANSVEAATVTIHILNDAPTATDRTVDVGHRVATPITLTGTDPNGDTLSFSVPSGTTPHGTITCTGATGASCTYTSTTVSGADTITFTADDGFGGTDTGTITINLTNQGPIAHASNVTATRHVAKAFTLAADDPNGDPLTYSVVTDPTKGTATCIAADCTYTSRVGETGSDALVFKVEDGQGGTDQATVTIDLANPTAPTTPGFGTVGSPLSVRYSETVAVDPLAGSTGQNVSLDTFAQGSHGSVVLDGGTNLLVYSPTGDVLGADSFTYALVDEVGQHVTGTVYVNVVLPAAPTAGYGGIGSGTGTAETPFTTPYVTPITIDALGSSAGYHLTVSAVTDGDHGSVAISPTSHNPVYTPNALWHGLDTFTYTVRDGFGQTDTATAYVSTSLPAAPVAPDYTKPLQAPGTLTVAAPGVLDSATGTNLTITDHTNPTHGTLVLNTSTGGYSYTPALGYAGSDSFTYTVTDAFARTATGTVTLSVSAPDAPTVDADQHQSTAYQTLLTVDAPGVLAGSSGTALAVTGHTDPTHGSVSVNADGSYTYLPANGFAGSDSFTATVSDPYSQSALVTVHITVGLPAGPSLAPSSISADYQTPKTVDAPGALTGSSGVGLTLTSATDPAHGDVTIHADGSYTYTPDNDFVGLDSFDVTATDAFGRTASTTISVQVTADTGTTLVASPSPSTFSQSVQLAATVTAAAGSPTGSVTFYDGTTSLGSAEVVSGQAILATNSLSAGSHTLTAAFTPTGANHRASTSDPVSQQVDKAHTTSTVVSSANPANAGQAVTFTATVSGPGGTPTGSVTFLDGATSLGSGPLNGSGQATLTTSTLASGTHHITVSYSPTGTTYLGSTSGDLVQVVGAPVTVTSSISTKFNTTAIPAGRYIWFDPVAKVRGLGSSAVTVKMTNASITYGTTTVPVPNATITFDPLATRSTSTFDTAQNRWLITVPADGAAAGNTAFGGIPIRALTAIAGGLTPVKWSATFTTVTPGINIDWKWGAAVYSSFNTNLAGLGLKPVDDKTTSAYLNTDLAGTPEAYKASVAAGALGTAGANYTGTFTTMSTAHPA